VHKNQPSISTWALEREKGKDRTVQEKKAQKRHISPVCGEAPTEPNSTKICMVGDVGDVITDAKFRV